MIDPIIIAIALACGMLSRMLGLPALIGYLAAGFVLHESQIESGEFLHQASELGITLLLFSVGLKLDLRQLLAPRVWGTTLIHMVIIQLLMFGLLLSLASFTNSLNYTSAAIVAFAMTFSSTVFVVRVLQDKGEMAAPHAHLAIGVLIIQDLAAVIFLAMSTGNTPQPEALLLLLLIPMRKPLLLLLQRCGHGELFILFGLTLAVGGAAIFDAVGIKGDLGALIIGVLLAGHIKTKELAKALLQFKDLFLVGFFLTIGLTGWPSAELAIIGILLGLIVIIKPILYFLLFTLFKTRPRTSFLSSMALTNYSEFGLIVIAIAVTEGWVEPQWSATIALALAISFLISAPLNTQAHSLYQRWKTRLIRFEPENVPQPDLTDIKILVLGMGQIGTSTYDTVRSRHGDCILALDENIAKIDTHQQEGRKIFLADASDPDFWHPLNLENIVLIMLALTNHEENKLVAELLSEENYQGHIAAVARFPDEVNELKALGCSALNLSTEAGVGFANCADIILTNPPLDSSSQENVAVGQSTTYNKPAKDH
ncbi:MAG: cation:proton antiporter family protein [Pseudomonadales bacterium]